MTITDQQIESLRASISIASLLERDGHKLIRCGAIFQCLCPFHRERTPSCCVYDDHLYCYGCAAHADIFAYIMKRDNCGFVKAVETLSGGRSVVSVTPKPKSPRWLKDDNLPARYFEDLMTNWTKETTSEDLHWLADDLGVAREPLHCLGVAWADDHNAFAIPMRHGDGTMCGIRLRDKNAKKWAVKGSRQGLFIPTGVPRREMAVTEGPTDCAAVLSMGLFAIGKSAAMQAPEEILIFIKIHNIQRVIVFPDNDPPKIIPGKTEKFYPGLKGASKLIDVCPVPTCQLVMPTKDVRAFANLGGSSELLKIMIQNQSWSRRT